MMDIEWEDEWEAPLAEIREKYGINTYRSAPSAVAQPVVS